MVPLSRLGAALCTSPPYRVLARRVLLPFALDGVRPAGQVLEIGAGSGAMAAALAASSPELVVVATDADARMVHEAARALRPFAGRARAEQADAADLPFEDGRFDLVLSCAMLHHLPSPAKAIAEALRVLAVGGHLVGYDLCDVAPLRLVHREARTHLWRPGELEAVLLAQPATDVRTTRALGGLVVRFRATKAAA